MMAKKVAFLFLFAVLFLPAHAGYWTRHAPGGIGGQPGIAVNHKTPNILYASQDNGGLIKSVDKGETWVNVTNNMTNELHVYVRLDPLNPDVVYALCAGGRHDPPLACELFRSSNGGDSWEILWAGEDDHGQVGFGAYMKPNKKNLCLPFDAKDEQRYDANNNMITDVLYGGGWGDSNRDGVWKSSDEGSSFTQVGLRGKDVWVVRSDPDNPGTVYAGANNGGFHVSYDEGKTWKHITNGIPDSASVSDIDIMPGKNVIYVSAEYGGIYKSTDGGESFENVTNGAVSSQYGLNVIQIDKTDTTGKTVVAGAWRGEGRAVYRTTNGGSNWTKDRAEISVDPYWFRRLANPYALEQGRDGTMYLGTWRGIYRYNPTKKMWEVKSKGVGNAVSTGLAFERGNPSVIHWMAMDAAPIRSEDGGTTWKTMSTDIFPGNNGPGQVAVSPTHPNIIYLANNQHAAVHLTKSTDGGDTWALAKSGITGSNANAVVVSPHNPDVAYAGTDKGIFKTVNGGGSWQKVAPRGVRMHGLAITKTIPEVVVGASGASALYIGEKDGMQWSTISFSDSEMGKTSGIRGFGVYPHDFRYIAVGTARGAWVTSDAGKTWTRVWDNVKLKTFIGNRPLSPRASATIRSGELRTGVGNEASIDAIVFDPDDPQTFYMGGDPSTPWMGPGVLKTTDGGKTWNLLADESLHFKSVNFMDIDSASKDIIVVGADALYYYHAKGLPSRVSLPRPIMGHTPDFSIQAFSRASSSHNRHLIPAADHYNIAGQHLSESRTRARSVFIVVKRETATTVRRALLSR